MEHVHGHSDKEYISKELSAAYLPPKGTKSACNLVQNINPDFASAAPTSGMAGSSPRLINPK
jgi:hypothetical protein